MRHFLATTLHGLVELYPPHIWKENYLLFPMTDKILDEKEQLELVEKFAMVEREIGVAVHQRFEEVVEQLVGKTQQA
jgi:hemerythrin-like domain-containing protein